MTFLCKECKQIMLPILQQGLPKAGVIRTFPRVLAHSPLDYGGLDIPHLFTEQIIAHIHTILCYGPVKDDPTSLLLHTTAEAMRLELGYSSKLLAAPLLLGENVTNSWIKHMWQSTQESGVTILTDFADLPLKRHGDVKLMRLFVQNGWKQPALQNLNHCRMYLKVFHLSDIVTGSGEIISQQFWARPHPADSPIEWPKNDGTYPDGLESLASSLNVCSTSGPKPEASNPPWTMVHPISAQWLVLSPFYLLAMGSPGDSMDMTWRYTSLNEANQFSC